MTNVYVVWFRSHKIHSEEPATCLGIFTTRTIALLTARKASQHPDDEWDIMEHFLNQEGRGEVIWESYAEDNPKHREFYLRYWPAGYPMRDPK